VVACEPSKLVDRVRLPTDAPYALVAQGIEHPPSKRMVAGSNPAKRANYLKKGMNALTLSMYFCKYFS
jgi:hypothetical protein